MKLIDVINKYDNPELKNVTIQYRTIDPDKNDLFAGICHYDRDSGELFSDDGDIYDLNDEIIKYEMYTDPMSGEQYLIVWYESEWITS